MSGSSPALSFVAFSLPEGNPGGRSSFLTQPTARARERPAPGHGGRALVVFPFLPPRGMRWTSAHDGRFSVSGWRRSSMAAWASSRLCATRDGGKASAELGEALVDGLTLAEVGCDAHQVSTSGWLIGPGLGRSLPTGWGCPGCPRSAPTARKGSGDRFTRLAEGGGPRGRTPANRRTVPGQRPARRGVGRVRAWPSTDPPRLP
jgi:hypothetical protein